MKKIVLHDWLGYSIIFQALKKTRYMLSVKQSPIYPLIYSLHARNYYAIERRFVKASSVICQTTGPKPLAKRFLHTVRSRASSFNSQYPLLSLRSSSNFLRLLPRLPVTSIPKGSSLYSAI